MYEAPNRKILLDLIRAYRKQNELEPLDFLPAIVEHYQCVQPDNIGRCTPAPQLKRGFIQFVKGGIALLKNVAYKSYASQNEADRRAEICLNCLHNTFPDRGPFVRWADDLAEAAVGDRKSTYHDQLGNCGVCSCLLRSKVFYNGTLELTDDELAEMRKVNCWQPALAKKG